MSVFYYLFRYLHRLIPHFFQVIGSVSVDFTDTEPNTEKPNFFSVYTETEPKIPNFFRFFNKKIDKNY